MTKGTKMIVGCGYLGQRVARDWRQAGARVLVGTRRPERAKVFEAAGYEALVLDVTQPKTLWQLPALDTLLFAVAHDPRSNTSREAVLVDGLRNVLDAVSALSNRVILISTTGVYGQRHGEWVDEQSPCAPQRAGGQCYLEAEQLLRDHRWGARSIILRLAGIYGPGRIPYLDRLRSGLPLPVDASGYLNLIHVEDAVRAVIASEATSVPDLFVVADGSPVRRAEYYQEVARGLGCAPTFVAPDPDSPQAQRALANKRINNRRLVTELDFQLAYPSYREGIAAIMADMAAQ